MYAGNDSHMVARISFISMYYTVHRGNNRSWLQTLSDAVDMAVESQGR